MDYAFQWKGLLTEKMSSSFDNNGFFVARGFLDGEEIKQTLKVLREPDGILKHGYTSKEPDTGYKIRQTLCLYPGDDVTGMLVRSEKVAKTCEMLLRSEVYHWCSMFMIKDARVGGEHVWHQDHGFWYNDGCLYPDIITVWIALDKCTRENSCKQVLRGSHLLGRFDHIRVPSGQLEADPDMVDAALEHLDRIYLEMEPGDAFIHHSNLLHRSDPNTSNHGRRAFLCCINSERNSPVRKSMYPSYNKLDIVPDIRIKECRNYTDFTGKQFVNCDEDLLNGEKRT